MRGLVWLEKFVCKGGTPHEVGRFEIGACEGLSGSRLGEIGFITSGILGRSFTCGRGVSRLKGVRGGSLYTLQCGQWL